MGLYDNSALGRDLNANAAEFLKVDLEIGLTFANIALHATKNLPKRNRNQTRARQAYDTVSNMSKKLNLTQETRVEIHRQLDRLRTALQELGESFA